MKDIKEIFIVDEEEFNKNFEELIGKIVDFVRISKEGKILLSQPSMKNTDKIGISIIARFLGNTIEKQIPSEVTTPELSEATGLPQHIVSARLSELIKQRFVKRVETGVYMAIPYRIEIFVEKINKRYGGKK